MKEKKGKKKKICPIIRCGECKRAKLMQWYNNPVIAECSITGERNVASTRFVCLNFEKDTNEKMITPMIR